MNKIKLDWSKPDYANDYSKIIIKGNFVYKKQSKEMTEREVSFLSKLVYSGYVPEYKQIDDITIRLTKIKQSQVTNEKIFMAHYDKIIDVLKKENIRHGDLTSANVFVVNNRPILIDFNESRLYSEKEGALPDKRPEPDIFWLFKTMVGYCDAVKYPVAVNVRVPVMWYHIKQNLPKEYKTVIDLGAGNGDISIRFLLDNRTVGLVENNQSQLDIFNKTFQHIKDKVKKENMILHCTNILSFVMASHEADIIICFDILQYFTHEQCIDILKYITKNSKVAFISIPYKGDGSQSNIKDDKEMAVLLCEVGFKEAEIIGSSLVEGRMTERKIWKCC